MAYSAQTWVDGVTPLDSSHMTHMEAGITDCVDADAVVTAASRIVANKLAGADAQPAFRLLGDGKHEWGPGGGAAPDANLYRLDLGLLKTDGHLMAGGHLFAQHGQSARVTIGALGPAGEAGITFSNTNDTNLYRLAAGVLKTDGYLLVGNGVQLDKAGAGHAIYWGSANDTNLYRSAADTLKTDGHMDFGRGLRVGLSTTAQILFGPGPTPDTNLYRSAAGQLKTDGLFRAGTTIVAADANAAATYIGAMGPSGQSAIVFSLAGDTNLYRSAAAVLKTDGRFTANELGGGVYDGIPSGTPKRTPFYDNATGEFAGWIPVYPTAS